MTRQRAAALPIVAIVLVLTTASPAAAHGAGGQGDLALPLWQFLYSAFFALVITHLVLRISWNAPRLEPASHGRILGRPVDVAIRLAAGAVRVLGLVLFVVTVTAAWFGDRSPTNNIAPVMTYVLLWIALPMVIVVAGDVWGALSPYDTIAAVVERGLGRPRAAPPAEATNWPAAAGVLGFVWLELCYHSGSEPRVLAVAITAYSVVVLACVARNGREWLRTGEAFTVVFGLFAAMAPFVRDDGGRVRIRAPFSGLGRVTARRGTVMVLVVALAATGFDGVQNTRWWSRVADTDPGWATTLVSTLGLLVCLAIVATVYAGAASLASRIGGDAPASGARRYVRVLVPIAFGTAVAHSFFYLLVEGQAAIALASNPYGRNWNLFGTVDRVVDLQPIAARSWSWVQVVAIVIGHCVGAVAAHDRAVERHAPALAVRAQMPLLAAMVASALGALLLLLNS